VKVSATSEEAALRIAKPFFPKAVRESLSEEETKILRSTALEREGVYSLSEYYFYPRRRMT
jgi:hypothetical protein